jgi:integrase
MAGTKVSDTKFRNAKPAAKPYKLVDRDGLYLHIMPTGAKSWRYDYRLAGMRQTLTMGRYPDVGLGMARKRLDEARGLVAQAISPARVKKEKKADARLATANTLEARAEHWYSARALARSESWKGNARRWLEQDIYPAIGSKPIRDVTAGDIERVVRAIAEKRGAKSAHYARLTLAGVFKAQPRALNLGNPARDVGTVVEIPKGKPLGQPLPAKDIPALLEAVDKYPMRPQTKFAIHLLIHTFARKRELTDAPWSEFDLDRAEWVIAAERMKMSKPHIVPLSRQAVEMLSTLKPLSSGSPYVFPNVGDLNKPMAGTTLNKALGMLGFARFTPHSARSTASTELNKQGWNADAIELQLAHTERNSVRAAYNYADRMDERRRMMQHWSDFIDGLATGGNVVSIGRAA